MNFDWDENQKLLYARTLRLAQEGLSDSEPDQFFPASSRRKTCAEAGLFGLMLPEESGGLGCDALTSARVFEALGEGCPDLSPAFSIAAHGFACAAPIARFGDDHLRGAVLPGLAAGDSLGAGAASEAEAGSDVFAMQSSAVRHGEDYILNGVKSWVSNGPGADLILVYAKTAPGDGYLGISAFVVEAGTPGFAFGAPIKKAGLRASPVATAYFEECRVPASRMLGKPGEGSRIFQWSMRRERSGLFAAYLGMMQRQLDRSVLYARQRRQFGRPIGEYQAVSHRIADMKLRLESARWLLYRACWLLDRADDTGEGAEAGELEAALAKLAVSEAAIRSGLDAIQIHGGMGITTELNLFQELQDAVPGTIFSGTSEIQREIIARELGL